jgi:Kef-type K+ transport system membrane component KefB
MPEISLDMLTSVGLLLILALVVALIAEIIKVPKVTSYLLVGLIAGPSVLGWIEEAHLEDLHIITRLAMAVVLFYLGAHFPLSHLRKIGKRAAQISAGELSLTFVLVAVGVMVVTFSWQQSILLGCLALATAPATTILVLKEFQSEGDITEYTSILVAINNLVCIVAFELAFVSIELFSPHIDGATETPLTWLAISLLGSVLIGGAGGLLISYGCGLLKKSLWLVLIVGVVVTVLGISEQLSVPYMLTFLAMGIVVANISEDRIEIVKEINSIMSLLCVVFFAVHGADLDLSSLSALGLVGAVYIVCRFAGKYLGVYFAAKWARERAVVRNWLGLSIMAQAGAAIALCAIAKEKDPSIGIPLQTVILGSVVVFEIIGPILTRQALLQTGEIPIAQAIHHSSHSFLGEFREIWNRLLISLGRDPAPKVSAQEMTVRDMMRKNVRGIAQEADFESVIAHIEHSHDNIYPVVDERNTVVGIIRYPLLSQILFDRNVSPLVRAMDLATSPDLLLYPDDSAAKVFESFDNSNDDLIPVVTREKPHALLGVARRNELQALLIRKRKTDTKNSNST